MRKDLETIESVRNRLTGIKGQDVCLSVNRGRRKIEKFDAKLVETYTSVFMVSVGGEFETNRSYSYTEILCGNVHIKPKNITI
ncbi:MAG: Veg family protein [Clostridia bacterium]|nr:Veg family protein [Clostridia bacterium]